MGGDLSRAEAVSDAELEALEKQIEQQELEEKAKVKRDKEVEELVKEKKRLVELEKQRLQERKRFEEEKNKLEDAKRKLEETRQAELERKQHEEEAKRNALAEQKRKAEDAANARVTVVFFRKSAFLGSGFQVAISNNGTAIGSLPNGSFFIHDSPVGKHTFSTDKAFTSYGFSETFEFNSGEIYYIQLLVGGKEGLGRVSENEGRNGIKQLENTGSINPVDVLSNYDASEAYQVKEQTTQKTPL